MGDLPEQAIVIIVFLIIGAARWFLERVAKKEGPPPSEWDQLSEEDQELRTRRSPGSLEELYDQARREIQDRQSSQPSPAVVQEKLREYQPKVKVPPPLPEKEVTLQKAEVGKTELSSKSQETAYQIKKVKRPTLSPAEQQAIVDFEQFGQKPSAQRESSTRIRELLKSPGAARDAIILAEILGKPKGA